MGADIKSLRNRIKSVKSTLHLTKAMGLVASSKIRRAQESRIKSAQYALSLRSLVNVLLMSQECAKSPYVSGSGEGEKIVVIAGDRGLAGGYNVNVFRFIRENHPKAEIYALGKKACEKYGQSVRSSEQFGYSEAHALALELCRDFASGKYARIGIVYTEYKSMISQEPRVQWIFPLVKEGEASSTGAIFEPDEATILEKAVPIYVAGVLFAKAKEGFACEVVARRNAMDSAGKNATAMIDNLQLKYNRARQGAITQEITEIVAGSGE